MPPAKGVHQRDGGCKYQHVGQAIAKDYPWNKQEFSIVGLASSQIATFKD